MSEPRNIRWREWALLVALIACSIGITAAVDRPSFTLTLTLLAVVLVTLLALLARYFR